MTLPFNQSILKLFSYLFLGFFLIQCSKETENPKESLYKLSISKTGSGDVSNQSGEFEAQSSITISAIPTDGFYFDRWEGFKEQIETSEYTFSIEQDLALTAIFLPIPELETNVELYTPKKIDENPVFMIENGGKQAYFTDKTGSILRTWNFDSKLGNEVKVLEDESVIGLFKPNDVFFSFGGYGGVLKKISPLGGLDWEFELNTEQYLLHHDFEMMPNGNILLLVWERFSSEEALNMGYDGEGPIYLEKIIEWNPDTRASVWEWRSSDHLIQEFNDSASNFDIITAHPEKIDLNYYPNGNGDLMHANGLYYDIDKDVIYLSVNYYSEVWVIDHSLNTEESKTNLGDLKYRFGNPEAYQGEGSRLFYNNHHPTLVTLDPLTEGRFLIFMNGSKEEQSRVIEFDLPSSFNENPLQWASPEETWSYTHPDLFFGKISGAYRLPNGNTLICEGDYGYWEVTRSGEVVWKYTGETNFWRGYVYPDFNN